MAMNGWCMIVLVVVFLLIGKIAGEYVISGNETCIPPHWNDIPDTDRPPAILKYTGKCNATVLRCYCVTPTNTTVIATNNVSYALGKCLEGCFITNKYDEYYNLSFTGKSFCSSYNRMGTLCGTCKPGYGPAVYSFSIKCIECPDESFIKRLALYILIAYGPLSVFLVIIVVFTVSTISTPLQGWIFVCQNIACSFYMRVLTSMAEIGHIDQYTYRILGSIYGIWNLDFFRSVYKPFCLHQKLTTLQVMSLDFLIAAYPLVVIVMLYLLVEMYSRHNCQILVIMWRPFQYCCMHFRNQLNIRTSLVDAFGTFFSLSFVKMFSTVIDVLTYSRVWEDTNRTSYQPYFQGGVAYFQSNHLPLAILSLFLLITFNLLPLLLLLLYSFPKTQFFIHFLPRAVQNMLFPFMDNILSCYKDGTNGTRNCRYFAVIYHILRMVIFSSIMWTRNMICYSLSAIVVIITVLLLTLIRPYKSELFNALDTFFLSSLSITLLGSSAYLIAIVEGPQYENFCLGIIMITTSIPTLYIIACLGYKVWRSLSLTRCLQALLAGTMTLLTRLKMRITSVEASEGTLLLCDATNINV